MMGRIAMGEGGFEHVTASDNLSGSVVLLELAEPLVRIADILARLGQTAEYKDHPVLQDLDEALSRLSFLYRAMIQTH